MNNRNTVKQLSIWAITSVWLMLMVVTASVIFSCLKEDDISEKPEYVADKSERADKREGPEYDADKSEITETAEGAGTINRSDETGKASGAKEADETKGNSDADKVNETAAKNNAQSAENTEDSEKIKQELILQKYNDESEIEYLSDDYCEYVRAKYAKIVVLDAGHGGHDGGTVTAGSDRAEKKYNLNILLKVEKLFEKNKSRENGETKNKLKIIYTRTDDVFLELEKRAETANRLKADFFISIHCNSHESKKRNGVEVLYYGGGIPPLKEEQKIKEADVNENEAEAAETSKAAETSETEKVPETSEAEKDPEAAEAEKVPETSEAENAPEASETEKVAEASEVPEISEEEYAALRSERSEKSKELAKILLSESLKMWERPDFGIIPRSNLLVLYNTEMPAAIIEVGYLSNDDEAELLEHDDIQEKTAQGIYNAILKAVGEE